MEETVRRLIVDGRIIIKCEVMRKIHRDEDGDQCYLLKDFAPCK
jgi:hypothetical protein